MQHPSNLSLQMAASWFGIDVKETSRLNQTSWTLTPSRKNLYLKWFEIIISGIFCTFLTKTNCFFRSSPPDVFLGKDVLKICSKFTGEHPCQNVISIKLLCNFIETAVRHGCSPVNLLHTFRTPFPTNSSGWLLLFFVNAFTENW